MKWTYTGKIQENNKRFSSGSVSIYVVHQTPIVQQIDLSVTYLRHFMYTCMKSHSQFTPYFALLKLSFFFNSTVFPRGFIVTKILKCKTSRHSGTERLPEGLQISKIIIHFINWIKRVTQAVMPMQFNKGKHSEVHKTVPNPAGQ